MIHPTAIIHENAKVHESVSIGAYSIIGEDVDIDAGNIIGSHCIFSGPTTIDKDNRFYSFSAIGVDPQDKKYQGEKESTLKIGKSNTIREYVSINRGTGDGGGETVLGDNNWIMAYVHIAHDCIVGNNVTFANNSTLAGHVTVDDHAILGGFTGVHQFCHVGSYSFAAISSVIVKDVPPYLMVSGNTAKPSGLNREGLKRHGFTSEEINILKKAYRFVYREGLLVKDALTELEQLSKSCEKVIPFKQFIEKSERGIVK